MKIEHKITKEEHLFSSDDKINWWGYGEWVEEIDYMEFIYKSFDCIVKRIVLEEGHSKDFHVFGGYFNGYVSIPGTHPYFLKKYEDMEIDCHFGLTFGECNNRHYWIGFDCAHYCDYVPSIEYIKKRAPCMQIYKDSMEDLNKKLNIEDIFRRTYKNIQFCIDECKSIADQLIEIGNK